MVTCVCACGAKYRFPEKAAGKTAQCKKCGESLVLKGADQAQVSTPGPNPHPQPRDSTPQISIESEPLGEEESQPLWQDKAAQGYWRALFWSALFPSSVRNLAAFLTLWLAFGLLSLIPLPRISILYFITILWLVVAFWFAAFRVAVLESAAAGQFQLPDPGLSADFWSDWLEPAFRWYGSWFVVLLPALIYATAQGYRGLNVINATLQAITNPPLPGMPGPSVDAGLMTLALLGVFFWPMVLLVAVIGGFGQLLRIDHILVSLGGSLMPYLVTVFVVAISYTILVLTAAFISPPIGTAWQASTAAGLGMWALKRILATGIDLYASIVAVRAIGDYFRHFGHRFAWNWGQDQD